MAVSRSLTSDRRSRERGTLFACAGPAFPLSRSPESEGAFARQAFGERSESDTLAVARAARGSATLTASQRMALFVLCDRVTARAVA
jgi:hypothetical protein